MGKFNLKKLYNGTNPRSGDYKIKVPIKDCSGAIVGQQVIDVSCEHPCKFPRYRHEFKPCDNGQNSYQMWCIFCGYAPINKIIGIHQGEGIKNVKHIGYFNGKNGVEIDFANKKVI
jgi:hypothetical protein